MNFQKLFDDYKIKYSLKTNRGWVNIRCPYCGGRSYKFGFNPKDDFCTCFACGYHDLESTLCKMLHLSRPELRGVLKDYSGRLSINTQLNAVKPKIRALKLPEREFTNAETKYLKKRGFDPVYLKDKYFITGGGITGRWKYRVIIPIIYNGKVVSWTARSILDKQTLNELDIPRYKHLPIDESVIDPKKILYNLDNCRGQSVVLLEGPFDVLKYDGNAVCSFGTAITEEQIRILYERFKKIYIIFDNEAAAQEKARKYGLRLAALGVDVEIINACADFGKNDIGECDPAEINVIKDFLKD